MTLKQGEEVNQKFETLQDSLVFYRKTIDTVKYDFKTYQIMGGRRLQKMYESYWQEYENSKKYKAESDSFRHMYMANKIIFLEKEEDLKRNVRHATIYATFLTLMVMLFAAL